jgi:hypothetical protein
MKAVRMFATAIVVFAAISTQAQTKEDPKYFSDPAVYKKADVATALKAFERCLAMDNAGVQESAIAQLAMVKMVLPEVEAAEITHRLEEMATSAPAPSTRYKAYITSQVYRNPELFASERGVEYNDADALFNALAARLQNSLLTYGGH